MRALVLLVLMAAGCTKPPPAPPADVAPAEVDEPVPTVRPKRLPPPAPPTVVVVHEPVDAGDSALTAVRITTEPPDASVSINHRDVGRSPLTVSLSVRSVFGVRAEVPGYEPAEQTLWPGPKRPTELHLTLEPTPLPPAPFDAGFVALFVESNPMGAWVNIDNVDAGTTPLSTLVTPGPHEVLIFAAGFIAGGEIIDAGPGETVHILRRLTGYR
jgi:PEGA domain